MDQDITCAPDKVRRIMTERHLKAIQPKSYIPKTSNGRADKSSDNLLLGQPHPEQSNQFWAGEITHIPTSIGWLYLAVVIDLCSRKIVDWALADHMRSELVMDALRQALGSRRIVPGWVFHSDRGSQYDSIAFRQLLGNYGMIQSMSARVNPYCNAWTESFMGTLKKEMLGDGSLENANDARRELFAYIESYYNKHRKHSALQYRTPATFEAA